MPLSGSTRMLRARRKDINLKPNRRLDRKSSKGMLFENEELRMRTIAINSEVEQGQQALKKLRRENELLRREVWSLRDEYAKMENALHKKETDGEESDQENSCTDGESEESQDEEENNEDDGKEEMPVSEVSNQEKVEDLQKSSWLAPRRSSKGFDGLSVIDEQTEETQTTDGYGNSRSSSLAQMDKLQDSPRRPVFGDISGESYYPVYTYFDPRTFKNQRKRCVFGESPDVEWGAIDIRPHSPYPYACTNPAAPHESRLQQILEPNIPLVLGRSDGSGWLYPPPAVSSPPSPLHAEAISPTALPSLPAPLSIQIPVNASVPPNVNSGVSEKLSSNHPLGIVQDRHGPDVFITDAYPYFPAPQDLTEVTSELSKLGISQKSENNPRYTTESHVLSELQGVQEGAAPTSSTSPQLPVAADSAGGDAELGLVACQFPSAEDSRQIVPASEDVDMRRVSNDKNSSKAFQSKLTLTLRFPENGRKSPARQIVSQQFPGVGKPVRYPTQAPLKHELPRLQTFARSSRTLPTSVGKPTGTLNGLPDRHPVVAADIPVPESVAPGSLPRVLGSSTSLDGLTTGMAKTSTSQGGSTKIKIPPTPPPRTSSCPAVSSASIPTPPVGVTALHHRAFRKGKSMSISSQHESDREIFAADSPPSHHSSSNPLLLSEPIATSSPTLQPKFNSNKSLDSHKSHKLRKQNSLRSMTQEETTDDGGMVSGSSGLIRKSSKSSKAEAERLASRKLRKQSQVSLNSLDRINPNQSLCDRTSSRVIGLNNISISSSSGLDSPTKSDRRKRRVSIKFNKRSPSGLVEEDRPGILTNFRTKSRDETDGTTSDRERTNSVSSRTSSVARRKLSSSSSRTIFHEEKIPWCGCWGNGCV